jgi:hypothetical protein
MATHRFVYFGRVSGRHKSSDISCTELHRKVWKT